MAGHGVHVVAPAVARPYVPGGQSVQGSPLPGLNLPAAHWTQPVTAVLPVVPAVSVPAGHAAQDVAPSEVPLVKVLAGHGSHAAPLPGEKWPAGHARQASGEVLPGSPRVSVPAGHWMQIVEPGPL